MEFTNLCGLRGFIASSYLRPWNQVVDVLEELRLGCTGVTAEKDVDLCAKAPPPGCAQVFL